MPASPSTPDRGTGTKGTRALAPGTVIAYSGLRPVPWRNGGGVTRQIAAGRLDSSGNPEESTGDDWSWRLSIADVRESGDFSVFTGMARILTVIEGAGMVLCTDGIERRLERYAPYGFDGAATTSATLPGGPIRDFNLITRNGSVHGRVGLVELVPGHPLPLTGGSLGVLLAGTATLLADGHRRHELERYDTVVGGGESAPVLEGRGSMAVVCLTPA
ncbi:hypothetical protein GCM10009715_23720 [Paeniglutamicibacter psychrophenolicus]|uniref:Environmental stress-induced protein Ves n=1 Tax=Paeniglutamicibacter psychrophenolicus TaxID=257454 RepID=A0ABS4WIM3_9MICC|nr:HutD family protein [Paeniglutamicibacter psychrophenolicus]MBP2375803.1 environmental stress-induced protein Ves [Paeniglutamicibacter psychrophenolicus]